MAAVVMPAVRRGETFTAVMSQPCRQAELLVPAAALAFRVPKVSTVFSCPFSSLIWEAKKFPAGLFGPESGKSEATLAPNSIRSPVSTASPSCAERKSFPETGRVCGVRKPVSVMSVLPCAGETTAPPELSFKHAGPGSLNFRGLSPLLICQFFSKTARIVGVDPACFSISSKNL